MYANHTKQKPPRSTRNVTSWIAVAPMRLVVVAVAPDCVPDVGQDTRDESD
jgi:hypothetical protein